MLYFAKFETSMSIDIFIILFNLVFKKGCKTELIHQFRTNDGY